MKLYWRVSVKPNPLFTFSNSRISFMKDFLVSPEGELIDVFRIIGLDWQRLLTYMMTNNLKKLSVHEKVKMPKGAYIVKYDVSMVWYNYRIVEQRINRYAFIYAGNGKLSLWEGDVFYGKSTSVKIGKESVQILVYDESKTIDRVILKAKEKLLDLSTMEVASDEQG